MPTSCVITSAISSRRASSSSATRRSSLARSGAGSLRPRRERGLRRRDRTVDVGGHAGRDRREHFLGGGIDHLEGVGAGGRHPRSVDVELVVGQHVSHLPRCTGVVTVRLTGSPQPLPGPARAFRSRRSTRSRADFGTSIHRERRHTMATTETEKLDGAVTARSACSSTASWSRPSRASASTTSTRPPKRCWARSPTRRRDDMERGHRRRPPGVRRDRLVHRTTRSASAASQQLQEAIVGEQEEFRAELVAEVGCPIAAHLRPAARRAARGRPALAGRDHRPRSSGSASSPTATRSAATPAQGRQGGRRRRRRDRARGTTRSRYRSRSSARRSPPATP